MKSIGIVTDDAPIFDGWNIKKAKFKFVCQSCQEPQAISIGDIQKASWNWKDDLDPTLLNDIALQFSIDLNDRFIGNGMKTVVSSKCTSCGQLHYAYFNIHEYVNSCYRVFFLGMAIS